ncbi:MAG: ankyrin repeat protein [Chloroflexi bacterium]|nr:ankyrin repeat protein [Chloroflexota bacterium]
MSFDRPVTQRVAVDRVTTRAPQRGFLVALLAALLAAGSLAAAPAPASAAGIKVTIVVGPAGSATSTYLADARSYASLARSYGATVVEVYTPNATWSRVRSAAQGANLLIYLGHGNGYPNPYHTTLEPKKVDGFGLNPYAGSGNTRTAYYGEYYVRSYIRLAPNAVVILNHACYTAGNSEPGRALPTLTVARKRVDNFGAGFLRAGAKVVFAEVRGKASHIIRSLFTGSSTMSKIFWSSPYRTYTYRRSLVSVRTPGATGWLDPYRPGYYYRSVVGNLSMTAATWRP